MTPPINLPDGTEVSEVILPDGSTASEVIAPDGSTVFGAIPDSAIHRWRVNDDSDTTTAIDDIGSLDATINGASYTTTAKEGTHALSHDGTDDYATFGTIGLFDGTKDYSVSVWVYVNTFPSSLQEIIFHPRAEYDTVLCVRPDNELGYYIYDGNYNRLDSGNGSVGTNSWAHLTIAHDATNSEVRGYLNGSKYGTLSNPPDPLSVSESNYWGGENSGDRWYLNGIWDDGIVFNEALTDQQVSDFYGSY